MGLRTAAPFSPEALAGFFPGLEMSRSQAVVDRVTTPVILARADGMVLFEIFPAAGGQTVGRVITRSPAVAGPDLEVIGSTRLRDLPPEKTAVCTTDDSTGEKRPVCAESLDAPLTRVFRPQTAIVLPRQGAARLEALAGGDVLVEIRWRPPAPTPAVAPTPPQPTDSAPLRP
jgi:hypothetical protein